MCNTKVAIWCSRGHGLAALPCTCGRGWSPESVPGPRPEAASQVAIPGPSSVPATLLSSPLCVCLRQGVQGLPRVPARSALRGLLQRGTPWGFFHLTVEQKAHGPWFGSVAYSNEEHSGWKSGSLWLSCGEARPAAHHRPVLPSH